MQTAIHHIKDAYKLDLPPVVSDEWTLVIPAAGRGSRLQYSQPKILFPINERPIIHWLLDLARGQCTKVIFVVNDQSKDNILQSISAYQDVCTAIAIQSEPLGMADAVYQALSLVDTKHVATLWGDQVSLRKETFDMCQRIHQRSRMAALTLPTIIKPLPYLSFVRDSLDNIVDVIESREIKSQPDLGESDCGFFCFDTSILSTVLNKSRKLNLGVGRETGEFNLLPLFPLFGSYGEVNTIRIDDPLETLGVNTRADAEKASKLLLQRSLNVQ